MLSLLPGRFTCLRMFKHLCPSVSYNSNPPVEKPQAFPHVFGGECKRKETLALSKTSHCFS